MAGTGTWSPAAWTWTSAARAQLAGRRRRRDPPRRRHGRPARAARSPEPPFALVICEDIERSARDNYNSLKLERELREQGIALVRDRRAIRYLEGPSHHHSLPAGQAGRRRMVPAPIERKNVGGMSTYDGGIHRHSPLRVSARAAHPPQPDESRRRADQDPPRPRPRPRAPIITRSTEWRPRHSSASPPSAPASTPTRPPTRRRTRDRAGRWPGSTRSSPTPNTPATRSSAGPTTPTRPPRTSGSGPTSPPTPPSWTGPPGTPPRTSALSTAAHATGSRSARADLRTYPFRSRIHCKLCKRRMCGVPKPTPNAPTPGSTTTTPARTGPATCPPLPAIPAPSRSAKTSSAAKPSAAWPAYALAPGREERLARAHPQQRHREEGTARPADPGAGAAAQADHHRPGQPHARAPRLLRHA